MGKSPKPLTILVHPVLANTSGVQALASKGHKIVTDETRDYCPGCHHLGLEEYDLVLGPNCWRMDESMLDYLELAIKGARTVKYPKERSEASAAQAAGPSVGEEK